MKTSEEIKKGARYCISDYSSYHCGECPYRPEGSMCKSVLLTDLLSLIQQLESSRWKLFDTLSTAYYGKQMYGLSDDGTVYSRYSCDEMSFEQAVDEFRRLIVNE